MMLVVTFGSKGDQTGKPIASAGASRPWRSVRRQATAHRTYSCSQWQRGLRRLHEPGSALCEDPHASAGSTVASWTRKQPSQTANIGCTCVCGRCRYDIRILLRCSGPSACADQFGGLRAARWWLAGCRSRRGSRRWCPSRASGSEICSCAHGACGEGCRRCL
jgi:hypothetical protein